jgi:hypothetical protein
MAMIRVQSSKRNLLILLKFTALHGRCTRSQMKAGKPKTVLVEQSQQETQQIRALKPEIDFSALAADKKVSGG